VLRQGGALKFENYGPFVVPRRGPIIDRPKLGDFWRLVDVQARGLSNAQGCYVFAIKAGQGYTPWYVGKAAGQNGFFQEALSEGKQNQYNWAWSSQNYGKGTMVLFFVARRTASGRDFSRQNGASDIDWLERHLISLALEANNDLLNVHYTRIHRELFVPGVINDPAKKFSYATTDLQRTLNIHTKKKRSPKKAPVVPPPIDDIAPTAVLAPSPAKEDTPDTIAADPPLDAIRLEDLLAAAPTAPDQAVQTRPVEDEPRARFFLFGRRRS